LYAVTEVKDCGATTDYATVVRVGRTNERQGDAEEVFVGDSNHGAAAQSTAALRMRVVWTAPRQLSVVYGVHGRVFKHVAAAKGAFITFRADDVSMSPPVP